MPFGEYTRKVGSQTPSLYMQSNSSHWQLAALALNAYTLPLLKRWLPLHKVATPCFEYGMVGIFASVSVGICAMLSTGV